MRLHRFFINTPIKSDVFDISDKDLVHQWKSVFRYNVGSQVILFDGFGTDYLCLISSLRNSGATVNVVRQTANKNKPKRNVWLCLGVIKKDNFDLVVQKATEIGVNHVVPVLCERSEKKNLNIERLQKIAIEATEQSGRGDIPKIHEIVQFKDLLNNDLLPNRAVFMEMDGENIHKILNEDLPDIAVFVGPEGGWSLEEVKSFKEHNIIPVSVGSSVLRSETAGIAVASLLLL